MKKAVLEGVLKVCLGIALMCVLAYFVLAVVSVVNPNADHEAMLAIAASSFMAAYIALILGAAAWLVLKMDT